MASPIASSRLLTVQPALKNAVMLAQQISAAGTGRAAGAAARATLEQTRACGPSNITASMTVAARASQVSFVVECSGSRVTQTTHHIRANRSCKAYFRMEYYATFHCITSLTICVTDPCCITDLSCITDPSRGAITLTVFCSIHLSSCVILAGCGAKPDTGYGAPGSDFKRVAGTNSIQACCDACSAETRCSYWVRVRSTGSCFLKSDQGSGKFSPEKGVDSGTSRLVGELWVPL
jgi:hypothetical protein